MAGRTLWRRVVSVVCGVEWQYGVVWRAVRGVVWQGGVVWRLV